MTDRLKQSQTSGSNSPEFTPRQEQVLEQALELIRAEGLAGLTMRKTADRMGFSEPAVYRHFKTKQDLVLGIIRKLEVSLLEPMHVFASRTRRPVVERIGDIINHHLELVAANNALPILLFAEASVSRDPRLGEAMGKVFRTYEDLLIKLLNEGLDNGEIDSRLDPADGAMFLIGAPASCALRMRLLADVSTKSRRKRLVQFIKTGILAPPEVC